MIIDPIVSRRSYFSFSPEPLSEAQLLTILEAATLAPSGSNNQPWRFYYAPGGTTGFHTLLSCLDEGNQRWAKNAGALVLSAALVKYTYKDKEYVNPYAWHDTGLATSMLMVQAASMGIKSHPMAGFDPVKARMVLGPGPDLEPVAAIALGFPGDENSLEPDLLKRQSAPRKRKPLFEIALRI